MLEALTSRRDYEDSCDQEGNAIVMSLGGRLDAVASPEFETSLSDWISKGKNNFLLNFTDVDYISSAGLRSILATSKKLKETQGKIFLTDYMEPLRRFSRFRDFYLFLESLLRQKQHSKRFDSWLS